MEGSGQQCCYDRNSYLMLSYDQQWGSRPLRSHNLGFLPWNEANKVKIKSYLIQQSEPIVKKLFKIFLGSYIIALVPRSNTLLSMLFMARRTSCWMRNLQVIISIVQSFFL